MDGYVSLEVNPHLVHDTGGTMEEARRLWAALNRPNVFIKVPVPMTVEGLPVIQQLISEGINVNVTLLFGIPRYRQVVEAYLAGVDALASQAMPIKSVQIRKFLSLIPLNGVSGIAVLHIVFCGST